MLEDHRVKLVLLVLQDRKDLRDLKVILELQAHRD